MENTSTDELIRMLWDYNAIFSELHPADCIIVMGSNDIRVANRAAELFLKGYAPTLLFSGNVGRLTEGLWDKPEAVMFAEVARSMGVPSDAILIEDKSTNTGENIEFTKRILEENHIPTTRFIIVHKPYMLRRAYAAFKKKWPEPVIEMTAPLIPIETYPNDIITKELLANILVGDTQRIREYPKRGFVIEQEMPSQIWEAFQELVRRGYTTELIKE